MRACYVCVWGGVYFEKTGLGKKSARAPRSPTPETYGPTLVSIKMSLLGVVPRTDHS